MESKNQPSRRNVDQQAPPAHPVTSHNDPSSLPRSRPPSVEANPQRGEKGVGDYHEQPKSGPTPHIDNPNRGG